MIFAVALGLPAGVIAAVNRGKFFDRALMSTALVGLFDADFLVGAAADHRVFRLDGSGPRYRVG